MFNEQEFIKLLFLLSDTQACISHMEKDLLYQLPLPDKGKLFRKTYYLSATSLAHILERHYYKISRHPACGKFIVDVPTIVHWIKEAFTCEPTPISGSLNFKRTIDTGTQIGFDKDAQSTTIITVITEPGGAVKTAFPGQYSIDKT
ncbi:MAG: hypothetical protein JWN83_819 [Chitinophagaceae bacterium]|nr:hypothetical protein [Chitinophagaceae bacterium]